MHLREEEESCLGHFSVCTARPRLFFVTLYIAIHICICICLDLKDLQTSGRWNNGLTNKPTNQKQKKKGNLTVTWQATSVFFLAISMKYGAHPMVPMSDRCRPNYIAVYPSGGDRSDPIRSEPPTYHCPTHATVQTRARHQLQNTKTPKHQTTNNQQQQKQKRQPVAATKITKKKNGSNVRE